MLVSALFAASLFLADVARSLSLPPTMAPDAGAFVAGSICVMTAGQSKPSAVADARVYVRPKAHDAPWIGPVVTGPDGRFTVKVAVRGPYVMRIYSEETLLWEHAVDVPAVLPPIVVRAGTRR